MNRGRISEIYLQYVRQHCSGIFGVKYDMNQKGLKPEIVNTDAKGCFFFHISIDIDFVFREHVV